MLHDQLGPAVAVQRTDLAKVGSKLDGPRLIVFIKLQLTEFQFPNTNQHSSTGLSPHTKPPAMPSGWKWISAVSSRTEPARDKPRFDRPSS